MKEKRDLRNDMQVQLSMLSSETRQQKSRQLFRKVLAYPVWKRASLILVHVSMDSEPDTFPIIVQALQEGKLTALPRVSGSSMEFHVLPPGNKNRSEIMELLEPHKYGFSQPLASLPVIRPSGHLVSLMLVPGVAFDTQGNRLGRGKGYYDRYIDTYEAFLHTLGICFQEQVVAQVSAHSSDKRVRALISDSGILYQKTQQNAGQPSG